MPCAHCIRACFLFFIFFYYLWHPPTAPLSHRSFVPNGRFGLRLFFFLVIVTPDKRHLHRQHHSYSSHWPVTNHRICMTLRHCLWNFFILPALAPFPFNRFTPVTLQIHKQTNKQTNTHTQNGTNKDVSNKQSTQQRQRRIP